MEITKIGFAKTLEETHGQIKILYEEKRFKALALTSKDQFLKNEFIYDYLTEKKYIDAEISQKIALFIELNPELNENCERMQFIISKFKNKGLKEIPLLAIIFLKKDELEI